MVPVVESPLRVGSLTKLKPVLKLLARPAIVRVKLKSSLYWYFVWLVLCGVLMFWPMCAPDGK